MLIAIVNDLSVSNVSTDLDDRGRQHREEHARRKQLVFAVKSVIFWMDIHSKWTTGFEGYEGGVENY